MIWNESCLDVQRLARDDVSSDLYQLEEGRKEGTASRHDEMSEHFRFAETRSWPSRAVCSYLCPYSQICRPYMQRLSAPITAIPKGGRRAVRNILGRRRFLQTNSPDISSMTSIQKETADCPYDDAGQFEAFRS